MNLIKSFKFFLLCLALLFSVESAFSSNPLDIEDPERADEHDAVMQLLSSQINRAQQAKIEHRVSQLSNENLEAMYRCYDESYDQMRQSEVDNLEKYVNRTTRLICFHSAIKGWLLGGSYTLAGIGGVVLGVAGFNLFDCGTQSKLTTASAGILLGAAFLRYLGYQSKQAYLVMSRDMQGERDRVGALLYAVANERKNRQLIPAQQASVDESTPLLESVESAPSVRVTGKGKEEQNEVVIDMEQQDSPSDKDDHILQEN